MTLFFDSQYDNISLRNKKIMNPRTQKRITTNDKYYSLRRCLNDDFKKIPINKKKREERVFPTKITKSSATLKSRFGYCNECGKLYKREELKKIPYHECYSSQDVLYGDEHQEWLKTHSHYIYYCRYCKK